MTCARLILKLIAAMMSRLDCINIHKEVQRPQELCFLRVSDYQGATDVKNNAKDYNRPMIKI